MSKETLVLNDDLGDSLPAVDELLKDHTNLMNSLLAYEEQTKKLTATSAKLLESGNYNDKVIKKTTLIMNEKWKGLKVSARDKQTRLEESKLLQQFLQDFNEVRMYFMNRNIG
jgi:vacuolar-type H+-ATPase subunit I/STV1